MFTQHGSCMSRTDDELELEYNNCARCHSKAEKIKEVIPFYGAVNEAENKVYAPLNGVHGRLLSHDVVACEPILPNNIDQSSLEPQLAAWILGEDDTGFLHRPNNYIVADNSIADAWN